MSNDFVLSYDRRLRPIGFKKTSQYVTTKSEGLDFNIQGSADQTNDGQALVYDHADKQLKFQTVTKPEDLGGLTFKDADQTNDGQALVYDHDNTEVKFQTVTKPEDLGGFTVKDADQTNDGQALVYDHANTKVKFQEVTKPEDLGGLTFEDAEAANDGQALVYDSQTRKAKFQDVTKPEDGFTVEDANVSNHGHALLYDHANKEVKFQEVTKPTTKKLIQVRNFKQKNSPNDDVQFETSLVSYYTMEFSRGKLKVFVQVGETKSTAKLANNTNDIVTPDIGMPIPNEYGPVAQVVVTDELDNSTIADVNITAGGAIKLVPIINLKDSKATIPNFSFSYIINNIIESGFQRQIPFEEKDGTGTFDIESNPKQMMYLLSQLTNNSLLVEMVVLGKDTKEGLEGVGDKIISQDFPDFLLPPPHFEGSTTIVNNGTTKSATVEESNGELQLKLNDSNTLEAGSARINTFYLEYEFAGNFVDSIEFTEEGGGGKLKEAKLFHRRLKDSAGNGKVAVLMNETPINTKLTNASNSLTANSAIPKDLRPSDEQLNISNATIRKNGTTKIVGVDVAVDGQIRIKTQDLDINNINPTSDDFTVSFHFTYETS